MYNKVRTRKTSRKLRHAVTIARCNNKNVLKKTYSRQRTKRLLWYSSRPKRKMVLHKKTVKNQIWSRK